MVWIESEAPRRSARSIVFMRPEPAPH